MTKVLIKQKRFHEKGFRLGRHVIKIGEAQEFELSDPELDELETAGPMAWLEVLGVDDEDEDEDDEPEIIDDEELCEEDFLEEE